MAFLLFTTCYEESHAPRQQELELCEHINRSAFDETYVMDESTGRQRYADLLTPARKLAARDDIVVIANGDIIFTWHTLKRCYKIQADEAYALSRWDITPEGIKLFNLSSSQDAWVFRGPPKHGIGGDYPFGVPGVDNKFAFELQAAGYKVLDPSRDIKSYHLHLSKHRPHNKPENRVSGPYLFVSPHKLGEQPRYKVIPASMVSRRASQ